MALGSSPEPLVIKALDANRLAQILIKRVQRLKLIGQRSPSSAASCYKELLKPAIHQHADLIPHQQPFLFDMPMCRKIAHSDNGPEAVTGHTEPPVAQTLRIESGFLELHYILVKRVHVWFIAAKEHSLI